MRDIHRVAIERATLDESEHVVDFALRRTRLFGSVLRATVCAFEE